MIKKTIATGLLFDRNDQLLIYLRDNIPTIPFPNCWDLFGGHVEFGETPEEALVREVKEELDVEITNCTLFRCYECTEGDAFPNTKYVFVARIDAEASELKLLEGQKLDSIQLKDRVKYEFANILAQIIDDYTISLA